jgi:flavodoxin
MKIEVRYDSKSGNTKKIANAIAQEAGVVAKSVNSIISEPVDLLFIGGGISVGKVYKSLQEYINSLTPKLVKQVAVFSTAMGDKSAYDVLKGVFDFKDIPVVDSFHCKGRFLIMNLNRPDDSDCAQAAKFAKEVIEKSK